MTSDMGELFNARKKEQQAKRAQNREASPQVLTDGGFEFTSKNGGAHLIVTTAVGMVDFWPGTGLFIARSGKEGRGVRNLMKMGLPGSQPACATSNAPDKVACPICGKRVKRLGVGVHAWAVHGAHVTTPKRGDQPKHLSADDLIAVEADADREMIGDDADHFGLGNIGNK